ncbi:MAG: hypothetical protein CFH41_00427 [Alphaproteobacteria bacterium MarineAlpha11_Bin1]|nr:MAG: hypothetical protein CFH41_00427 [Alphaproteobacteria bacterium MarineAlpha11_Bin1]
MPNQILSLLANLSISLAHRTVITILESMTLVFFDVPVYENI